MGSNANDNGQQVPPKVVLRKPEGQPQQGAPSQPAATPQNLQTMRIELPESEPAAAPAPAPVMSPLPKPAVPGPRPTVVVKPMPAAVPKEGERHQTMQINPDDLEVAAPAAAAPVGPSPTVSVKPIGLPSVPGAPAAKRETSRIPLEMAKPSFGAPGRPPAGPSTIRVKPVVIRQTVDLAQAVPDSAGSTAEIIPPVSPESGKRKTSRISLESVLSGQPGSASQTAEITPPEADDEPRTIRIKRSVERPSTKTANVSQVAAPIAPGQTARLELPPDTPAVTPDGAGTQTPTRKKTIKVRRPGMEGEEDAAPAAAATVARPERPTHRTEDVPHATFGVFAVLAMLVAGVLIYVLMAQTFGPNISLTTLSYGWPECDLGWPGKILPGR